MAPKFFYICAAAFLLALAYQRGASTTNAQAPSNSVVGVGVAATQSLFAVAVTANGDVYVPSGSQGFGTWHLSSNIFSGSPVPTQHESWGQVKARYRTPAGGSVTPGTDDK